MASRTTKAQRGKATAPRSLELSKRGIKTGADFASVMSAVMSDLIEGTMSPAIGNAVCNAGGKMLKAVEMQYRLGKRVDGSEERILSLVPMVPAELPQVKGVQ